MSIRFKRRITCLMLLLLYAMAVEGQTGSHKAVSSSSLQQNFNDAQQLQQTGRLTEAAEQYRRFLADALGELAMGYGVARDYAKAAPLFDEALALHPNSPSLLLNYAQTALTSGDLDRAKALATEFIQKFSHDRENLA